MKTWLGLFLIIFMDLAGCAPGYYERPAYRDSGDYGQTFKWYQNAETDEERQERIWRESASP